jgi:hypothetical protein
MILPQILRRGLRAASVVLFSLVALHAAEAPPKKILFFSKCSNFEHSVVRERGGQPSWAQQVLTELGSKHGLVFTFSKDGSKFTPAYLAQFDAYFFYTSGDLLSPGRDGNPPMTPAGKQALLDAVAGGKGFIGTHSAADTFHTDETAETNTNQPRTWRYQNRGDKADPYTRMIGGELLVHGTQQIGRVIVADPKFPGFANRGASFELMEEWYSMTNFAPDMHVLLVQDTTAMRDQYANGKDWLGHALQAPAVPLHLGADAWERPRVLHLDGTPGGQLAHAALPGHSPRWDRVGGRPHRCRCHPESREGRAPRP